MRYSYLYCQRPVRSRINPGPATRRRSADRHPPVDGEAVGWSCGAWRSAPGDVRDGDFSRANALRLHPASRRSRPELFRDFAHRACRSPL